MQIFTPFELDNCNVSGIKKDCFDSGKLIAIKTCVLPTFEIAHMIQESAWVTCIKAMDAANRNTSRYARKLTM